MVLLRDDHPHRGEDGDNKTTTGKTPIGVEELLIWAYQREKVLHDVGGLVLPDWPEVSGCGCEQIAEIEELGVRVDTSPHASTRINTDAEAVHSAVLAGPATGLVILHACAGTRPGWLALSDFRAEAKLNSRGRPLIEYNRNRDPLYCHIQYRNHPDMVEFWQATYLRWWGALAGLALSLDNLAAYRVRPFDLPREPWSLDRPKES